MVPEPINVVSLKALIFSQDQSVQTSSSLRSLKGFPRLSFESASFLRGRVLTQECVSRWTFCNTGVRRGGRSDILSLLITRLLSPVFFNLHILLRGCGVAGTLQNLQEQRPSCKKLPGPLDLPQFKCNQDSCSHVLPFIEPWILRVERKLRGHHPMPEVLLFKNLGEP